MDSIATDQWIGTTDKREREQVEDVMYYTVFVTGMSDPDGNGKGLE